MKYIWLPVLRSEEGQNVPRMLVDLVSKVEPQEKRVELTCKGKTHIYEFCLYEQTEETIRAVQHELELDVES